MKLNLNLLESAFSVNPNLNLNFQLLKMKIQLDARCGQTNWKILYGHNRIKSYLEMLKMAFGSLPSKSLRLITFIQTNS